MTYRSIAVAPLLLCACSLINDFSIGDAGLRADGPTTDAPIDAEIVTITTFESEVQANLVFVAAQDGDAEWVVLSGTGGVYTVPVTSGRFGIAYVCPNTDHSVVYIRFEFSTTAESLAVNAKCGSGTIPSATYNVQGTATGVAPGTAQLCHLYGCEALADGSFSIPVPAGTHDLVAIRTDPTGTVKPLLLFDRNVTLPPNRNVDFDFGVVQVQALSSDIVVGNGEGGPETIATETYLYMSRGGLAVLGQGAPSPIPLVPVTGLQGEDVNAIFVTATGGTSGDRWVSRFAADPPIPVQVGLPPAFEAQGLVASASPVVRFGATFVPWTVQPQEYRVGFYQGTPTYRQSRADLSPGYVGTASSFNFEFPDLTSLADWNPQWNHSLGDEAIWTVTAAGSNRIDGVHTVVSPPIDIDGLEVYESRRAGSVTP